MRIEKFMSGLKDRIEMRVRCRLSAGVIVMAVLLGPVVFGAGPFGFGVAHAEPFSDLLKIAIDRNDGLRASEDAVAAAGENVNIATGGYYPALDLRAGQGHERQNKVSGLRDTSAAVSTVTLSGSQLLWDNSVTGDSVRVAELQYELASLNHDRARREILFEALQAFHELHRGETVYGISTNTVKNMERQVQFQKDLIAQAFGIERDLLHVQIELTNSQATKISDDGALTVARNRFANVFRQEIADISVYTMPRLPLELLPASLGEAIDLALRNNLDIQIARKELEIANLAAATAKRSLWGATVNLNSESAFKRDEGGALGDQVEHSLGVMANIPLYNGGRDEAGYAAALETASQSENALRELQADLEERVRNAWDAVLTLNASDETLDLQAEISRKLFAIAQQELEVDGTLGRVLDAEANLLSVSRNAENAEAAKKMGYYQLLRDVGILSMDAFS